VITPRGLLLGTRFHRFHSRRAAHGTTIAQRVGMPHARQRLGTAGEDLACAELERLGYRIIERNYRSRFGEIDIVAGDAGTVVFVEVKAKTSGDFGDPVEEVTPQKMRQLASMGEEYYAFHLPRDTQCRFDVVAVDLSLMPPKITHYKDAFRPGW
jgi:putative endonuclease